MRSERHFLPFPKRERWQPLRSGFVNLYRFDREEFHYDNGRLLLRGNNGTGKSRVLALQLPFLLDGEVNPQRLEPDADPSKRVEWNLLMDRYPDRTGYTWIEFGRSEHDGGETSKEHYLTLGCGLSAVEGKPGVRQWFFITTQRIGRHLELVSDSGQVLGKERLREKIGSSGRVFETVGAYRRAVNEALFRLDEYRYASLINLLIQLRCPQLTRRLDEEELSRALSESMAPVSPAVIAGVAEAFANFESDRARLASSKAALAAVERFLTGYRLYAQVAARRGADHVLAAHYEYEAGMKEFLNAEADCDRSLAELARLKAEMQRLADEEHAIEAELAVFQQNSRTKDARALDRSSLGNFGLEQARREANERRRDAEWAASELADSSRGRKNCSDDHIRAMARLEECQARLAAATDAARRAASSAGLEHIHGESLARDTIEAAIQTQIEKIRAAKKLNERVSFARDEVQRVAAERDQLAGLLSDAREHLNAARRDHQSAITSFLGAVSDWTAGLTELILPFDEAFLRSVSEWCDTPRGPNPFAVASRKALEELSRDFAERRACLKQLEKTHEEQIPGGLRPQIMSMPPIEAQDLDAVLDSIDELNRREDILRGEAGSAPADNGVSSAYEYAIAVARHTDSLRSRLTEADEFLAQKKFEASPIADERDRDVADLGVAKWIDDLGELEDGIAHYRLALAALWPAMEAVEEARAASEWAWMNLEQAGAREERHRETANRVERQAIAAEIACNVAGQAAGAGFAEILERVDKNRQMLEQLRTEEREIRLRYHDLEVAVTRVDERLRNRTEMLDGQTDRRDTAVASLRTLASNGLLDLAVTGVADQDTLRSSTARTVEAAFEIAARLDSIDGGDPAWERHQKSVPSEFNTLMQELSAQGCQSTAIFLDDVFVATAVFRGQEHTMAELRQMLLDDVASLQMLLDAQEREILENHLVGSVSTHLRELLHAAGEQVRQMNLELEKRPMSTGMKLRFVWRPANDAPQGLAEARQRLIECNDVWSLTDRQMLGGFLHQQIQAVCSDIDASSWQESLADALDYRKWHRFSVERYQDGAWKRLTRRTYGTGSGGEKAIALTLPHFAAAASFYRSADPLAPRLILLDEVFVGIDADMRAKCMGLIDTFDLDFIMTSEREWGCYQTLSGVAIYHLSTRPDIDAVGLTRWVWNGRCRNLLHQVERG